MRGYAVFQVKVDQILIGNPGLLREPLEIGDAILVQPDGDLLLQFLGIRILDGFGKIVLLPHIHPR
jgi:hypothetical protein